MKIAFALPLSIALWMLSACSDSGGGYSAGYSSRYYDPWYSHGPHYYGGIYVPDYPDNKPGNRPDRPGSGARPSHPIATPDRPSVSPRPSIPSRARPTGFSGGMSRGMGLRGGGRR